MDDPKTTDLSPGYPQLFLFDGDIRREDDDASVARYGFSKRPVTEKDARLPGGILDFP